MNIASVVESEIREMSILGVPFEASDRPFIEYWRQQIPQDFEEGSPLKKHWLAFELGGIKRGKDVLSRLAKHVSLEDKVVLDVGAGNGGMCIAGALAGARQVHGIEVDASRIDLANRWASCRGVKIDIRQGVAEQLPFPDHSIDILLLWAVIEHVDSPGQAIDEMARVLRPGGYAVINAPNRLSPKFFLSDPHYQIMAVSALPRAIAKWWVVEVRKITSHYGVGIFPIYSLLMRKLRKKGFELVASEHHNYLVGKLENPELIQSKLRLPARALGLVGVNKLLAGLLRNTSPLFEVVIKKSA